MKQKATVEVKCECGKVLNLEGKDILRKETKKPGPLVLDWYSVCPYCNREVRVGHDALCALTLREVVDSLY